MTESTDRAYIAGFIDGEGCISISDREGRYFQPRVTITNTDREILEWILSLYPGQNIAEKRRDNSKHKLAYAAVWSGAQAAVLLEDVISFLRMKREQAYLVLELIESQRIEGRPGRNGLPDDVIRFRRDLCDEAARLNRRGA